MKQVYFLATICSITLTGKSCGSKPKIKNDDAIYFRPDEPTLGQAKPTTAEKNTYDSQIQTINNYPVQNLNPFQNNDYAGVYPEMGGNGGVVQRPTAQYQPQYSTNPVPVNDFDIQYYTTTNRPVTPSKADPGRYPNPFQSSDYAGVYPEAGLNGEIGRRPAAQYPTTPAPVNDFNNQYYPTTNHPVTTTKPERFTQGTIFKGQGFNVSAAIGKFGLDMLQNVNRRTNLVVSPYSVTTLLALLQQGATGETQEQINGALQMPVDVSAIAYKQLTDSLRERHSGHNILNVANNVFVSDNFQLNSNFRNKAIVNFGSEITTLNFYNALSAARAINKWVSTATNNKIDQLVSPDSISSDTQLVLVNALLFKGVWQMKFRAEATLPREFQANGKEGKTIPFMRARRYYRYGEDKTNRLQVIVLPFENQEYSLMMLLPSRQSSVADLIRGLTYNKLAEYHNLKPQDVDLEIPKFSVRSDTDLRPLLRQMGVTKMFSAASELFEIGYGANNAPQVSSAVHSAMLSIDEEGGTASAATAFTVVALSYDSPDAVFKANRPFLAILWDTKHALPLIMAEIDDPTS